MVTDNFCRWGRHTTERVHGLLGTVLLHESDGRVSEDNKDEDCGLKIVLDDEGKDCRNTEDRILRKKVNDQGLTMGLNMFSKRMW
jgi:hypothetical protein